jgi:hypothetical protein
MKQTENVLLRLDLSLYACVKLSPTKKKKEEKQPLKIIKPK